MIDTHCHLDFPEFDADRDQVVARARAAGVTDIVIPAVGPAHWERLLDLARGRPELHVGLGIHPQLLPELNPAEDDAHFALLERLLARGEAVAVGECGLDGGTAAQVPMERQVEVFRRHVELARRFRLPLLIHCLRAHDPLMALFRQQAPPTAIMHSYSGSAEQLRQYGAWDLYFSFGGPLTYERARKPIEALRAAPRERLLLESDAPTQTPRPHQGRCEPAYLHEIAGAAATALGATREEVDALTSANARRALGIAAR